MKIWWLNACSKKNIKIYTTEGFNLYNGTRLENIWAAPKIELIGASYSPKDFVPLDTNTALLVSQRVADLINNKFSGDVELLKYNYIKDKIYYVLNVVNLIENCLDNDKSIIIRGNNNEIERIEKHVFNEAYFSGEQIFKVKEYPDKIFITDGFKDLIDRSRFTGAEFLRSDVTLRNMFYGL